MTCYRLPLLHPPNPQVLSGIWKTPAFDTTSVALSHVSALMRTNAKGVLELSKGRPRRKVKGSGHFGEISDEQENVGKGKSKIGRVV